MRALTLAGCLLAVGTLPVSCQQSTVSAQPVAEFPIPDGFILGADVSYLPSLESQGLAFKDEGKVHPGLEILRHHGYNWIRLRIMNEPTALPNTLAYTIAEAKTAKAMGFRLLLDFHYSDDWADPAHQKTPAAWSKLSHAELVEAVFNFTRDTISALAAQGVMPDMVQVGNEVTSGMLWPDGRLPERWQQFAELVSAGIRGVRVGSHHAPGPVIMIHIDQGGNEDITKWFFDNLILNGVPFDVIGQSYYPWWQGSLKDLKNNLAYMAVRYRKPIILVETAYDWKDGEVFKSGKPPFPQTPEGQREFLAAVMRTVQQTPNGLGKGVFWWEPMAGGAIAKRGMFDDQQNALPALRMTDRRADHPLQ